MELSSSARTDITERYADVVAADVLRRIVNDVLDAARGEDTQPSAAASAGPSPFAVSWMDSYLAHWEMRNRLRPPDGAADDVEDLVRELVDVRFAERLVEIRDFLGGRLAVGPDAGPPAPPPPDGGPPEPGVPPAPPPSPPVGPAGVFTTPDGGPPDGPVPPGPPPVGPAGVLTPPDGGPPEPGVPPVGPAGVFTPPDGGPPEPGVPPVGPAGVFTPPDGGPPEPGVPPAGPDAGLLAENPWILYWFVSIKAPMLFDVIDAHITRRLGELDAGPR